ncbi:iron ABC transporter permease [Frankia sp. CNm7]|uniref:FecCD family ABC transporter permease n=1 Tax=Frankia nepalensis TaxID=1836974 RepID=UPI0019316369|nr:iron ABC transporter permease [Frankia nepalensis]
MEARPADRRPYSARHGRLAAGLIGLVLLLLAVSFLSIALGARHVGLDVVFDVLRNQGTGDAEHQVVENRIPRLVAGLLVGAALGLAGTIMQAVARNPLADPGLFGVNAGAAFAVVCAIKIGITAALGYVWFAMAGAAAVAVLVYVIGSFGGGATPVKVALAGAAMHAALTALTTAVLLTDTTTFDQYRFWSVGSLAGRQWDLIGRLAPFLVVGIVVALGSGWILNTLALGDEVARGLGQRVGLARGAAAATAVVLCAAATSLVGPLWFVGLVAPHVARIITGPDQRWILAYSAVVAAILLVGADVVGRLIARPGEVQVGVVMALVGAPVLVLLVRRARVAQP